MRSNICIIYSLPWTFSFSMNNMSGVLILVVVVLSSVVSSLPANHAIDYHRKANGIENGDFILDFETDIFDSSAFSGSFSRGPESDTSSSYVNFLLYEEISVDDEEDFEDKDTSDNLIDENVSSSYVNFLLYEESSVVEEKDFEDKDTSQNLIHRNFSSSYVNFLQYEESSVDEEEHFEDKDTSENLIAENVSSSYVNFLLFEESSVVEEEVFEDKNTSVNSIGENVSQMSHPNWDDVSNALKMRTSSYIKTLNISDIIKISDISSECRMSLGSFFDSLSRWQKWAVMSKWLISNISVQFQSISILPHNLTWYNVFML